MKPTALLTVLSASLLLAGCVTEPATDEPVVYGSITTTKPAKYKKPKPVKHDDPIFEVDRAMPPDQ
jgi:PBP1b-binding outer membrane lipoprotein LpoB